MPAPSDSSVTVANSYRKTRLSEDGSPASVEPNPVVSPPMELRIDELLAARGTRKERRARARRKQPATAAAFFATALDRKIHVVLDGRIKTLCGRQALALAPDAQTKRNRCPTCARALA